MASSDEIRLHRLEGETIFDLQSEAHALIDTLVWFGWGRNGVYAQLAKRLEVPPEMAHIGNMATMTQVERAIGVLRAMRREQKQRYKAILKERAKKNPVPEVITKKQRKQDEKLRNLLPLAEQRAALALLREKNARDAEIAKELEQFPNFIRPVVRFFKYQDED